MRRLAEVREARELMNEALDWSVFRWMFEKPRVRKTADIANDALDRLERSVKSQWCDQLKAAYAECAGKSSKSARRKQNDRQLEQPADPQLKLLVEKIKEADDAARRARMDAEETFDEAERLLNIGLAQEGCQKAIHSWALREKAIQKAEAAMETVKSET
jgi:hypothetical protein